MKHNIQITTTEALLLNKALNFDMQNEIDNDMAIELKGKINDVVEKDLTKKKPTDLSNKCGSCAWATPRRGTYVNCINPKKRPNFFARTNKACKKYEKRKDYADNI